MERHETLSWEKLNRVVKRGGQTTPVASFWRTNELQQLLPQPTDGRDLLEEDSFQFPGGVSSRKLAATLWELQHYKLHKMQHGGGEAPPPPRRLNHHRHRLEGVDPSDPPYTEMPGSSSSLRRQVDVSMMRHHPSNEKGSYGNLLIESPASYGSSMEIAPYKPAATPSSSVDLKARRTGEGSYRLKTSTELLKVLNRIWTLEEQHFSNMSLVKTLKKELVHARSKIKELVSKQQVNRSEMDELMNHITEANQFRKNKEQDRIKAAIQSMRDELDSERKLRNRSESLHRKLARDLHEVKLSLSRMSKEVEKERKSCGLLEGLCDEFALAIRDYEKEFHVLKQESDKDCGGRNDPDHLIPRMAESWLDERMHGVGENKSTVDKLSSEIKAFLFSKRNGNVEINGNLVPNEVPLNVAASAPRYEDGEDDDSVSSDSNCFELQKASEKLQGNECGRNHYEETVKRKKVKKKLEYFSPSHLQVKFEEHMAPAMSQGGSQNQAEVGILHKPENYEDLIRNHYSLMQADNDNSVDSSIWRSFPSPVRQWTEELPPQQLDVSETSFEMSPGLKGNNALKAKMYGERTKGHGSRQKASVVVSRNG